MRAISHVRIGRRRDGLQRIIWAGGPTGALRLNPAHHFRATAQLTRHDAARTKFMKNISKAGKGASLLPPGHHLGVTTEKEDQGVGVEEVAHHQGSRGASGG